MPFTIPPFQRFIVQCSATYNAGPFRGQGNEGEPAVYRMATLH